MKKKKIDKSKRIRDFFNAIDWMFQINNFSKVIEISKVDDPEENRTLAKITFDETYQQVTVTIYPDFYKQTVQDQRKCLLHELCHSITLPSKTALHHLLDGKLVTPDRIREINERETSQIENIIDQLLQGRLRYAVKAYQNYAK